MKNIYRKSGALLLSALLCGCTAAGTDHTSDTSQNSAQTSSQNDSSQTAQTSQESEMSQEQIDQIAGFSWQMFLKTQTDAKSSLVSPLSAFFTLGMCANGARGETLSQIEEVLAMPIEQANSVSRSVLDAAGEKDSPLQAANSVWIRKDIPGDLNSAFRDILEADYDAEIQKISFSSQSKVIDDWVSDKTNGMFKSIPLKPTDRTVMILLDALAFDGTWKDPVEEGQIETGEFTNADGTTSQATLLYGQEDKYIEGEGFKGFLKPYEGDRYALAFLIPADEKASLDETIAKADGTKLMEAVTSPKSAEVETCFPEFDTSTDMQLNQVLQDLGMTNAFSDSADFSGMISGENNLVLSEVVQKAKISVSRKGTKAAAVTEAEIMETALLTDNIVHCDRPFLYMLMDTESNIPLFIGTVQSMSAQTEESQS